jgi:hypothetical protein
MNKHSYQFFGKKSLRTISIIAGSMALAFAIGIETAGEVRPVVSSTNAIDTTIAGDMNGDGTVTLSDAEIALEIARGYREPTPLELSADPNKDYHITIDDALTIIDIVKHS